MGAPEKLDHDRHFHRAGRVKRGVGVQEECVSRLEIRVRNGHFDARNMSGACLDLLAK
jgi:hypothetical protein